MAAPGAGNTPLAFPQAAEPPRVWCASPVGTGDPQLGLLWGSTLLSAMRTTGHLALSWAHFGPGQCLQAGSCSVGGLLGPRAEGAAHSCGLPVLGEQKGWHKDPSPVTSWHPGPGKELVVSICTALGMPLSPSLWSHTGDGLRKDRHGGGSTTASGLLRELARPLCCWLWLSQVPCHPGETPGVTLDSRGTEPPKLTSSLSRGSMSARSVPSVVRMR